MNNLKEHELEVAKKVENYMSDANIMLLAMVCITDITLSEDFDKNLYTLLSFAGAVSAGFALKEGI